MSKKTIVEALNNAATIIKKQQEKIADMDANIQELNSAVLKIAQRVKLIGKDDK